MTYTVGIDISSASQTHATFVKDIPNRFLNVNKKMVFVH